MIIILVVINVSDVVKDVKLIFINQNHDYFHNLIYIYFIYFNIYHKIESSILPDDANPLVINELYALSIFEELSNYINIFFS